MILGILLVTYYRQHCAQRNAPVFKLLREQFWGYSPRRGDTLHRWGGIWHGRRDRRSPPPCQISPHRCNNKGTGPQNWNFYSDLIKMLNINAPHGRIPCAIFTKFAEFVPRFRMR